MVKPTVRLAAVLLADRVNVLVPTLLIGLKEAVTPVGNPGGVKLTVLALKPPEGLIEIVLVPAVPGEMVRLLGEAERLKLGVLTTFTVRLNVAVCVRLPEFPVIMMGKVPVAAVPLAVSVNDVVAVMLDGLKVTPLGRPEAAKAIVPENPFCGVTVIVPVPVAPCVIVRLLGEAERAKLGTAAAFTVRLNVAVCVRLPEVPVIVMGKVPVAAVLLAVSVSAAVPVMLDGLDVTPLGKPESERPMLPVKPFEGVTVTVLVPLAPAVIIELLAERLKFGVAAAAGVNVAVDW